MTAFPGPAHRWVLAVYRYCSACRRRTAQREEHECRGLEEHIEARCLVCDRLTSRARLPAATSPPGTQLRLPAAEV